ARRASRVTAGRRNRHEPPVRSCGQPPGPAQTLQSRHRPARLLEPLQAAALACVRRPRCDLTPCVGSVDVYLALCRAVAGEPAEGLQALELAHPVRTDAHAVNTLPAVAPETGRGERALFDAHEPGVGLRQTMPPGFV